MHSQQTHQEVIKELIFDQAVKLAFSSLLRSMPWLSWPLIRQISFGLFNYISGSVYDVLATSISFTVIEFRDENQKKEYDKRVSDLQKTISNGSQDDIEKSKQQFKDSLRDLIRFNP